MLHNDQVEAWLDDNLDFTLSYFRRKATHQMITSWFDERVERFATTETESNLKSNVQNKERRRSLADVTKPKILSEKLDLIESVKPIITTDNTGAPSFYVNNQQECPSTPTPRKKTQKEKITQLKTRRISQYQVPTNKRRNEIELNNQNHVIDERDMIMDLVMDITTELDLATVTHRILQNVGILLNADRCSLFLMKNEGNERFLVSHLFDVNQISSLEDNVVKNQNQIKIKLGQGAAGLVASTGRTLNISDAYKDSRFDRGVDIQTGYKTNNLLCMPIMDSDKKIVGVAQAINKNDGPFNTKDEKVFASYLSFCGIVINNAQLFEQIKLENRRNEVLLELARMLFEEQRSLNVVINKILINVTSLLSCERANVQLCDPHKSDVFVSQIFEHVSEEVDDLLSIRGSPHKTPLNSRIVTHVRQSGETVNVSESKKDRRFSFEEDKVVGIKTRSLLCVPIKNGQHKVIGVIQLINKFESKGNKFTKGDGHLLEAFAIFCGLGISQAKMYESQAKLAARQQVVLEVLSYHAIAPLEEYKPIMASDIPSSRTYNLFSFQFSDLSMNTNDTLRATLRMFTDLDLFEKFHIETEVFCRWLASVKRNYRPVRYHNWRHAFNVCQSAFCMMTQGGLGDLFDDIEKLAVLVSCLCHDLDHRGRTNDFQAKIEHPLARLYSTSTMENHHFNQSLMLLQSEGLYCFIEFFS